MDAYKKEVLDIYRRLSRIDRFRFFCALLALDIRYFVQRRFSPTRIYRTNKVRYWRLRAWITRVRVRRLRRGQ